MDVEKVAVFASIGFAIAIAIFVLWGPSPKPRKKGIVKNIFTILMDFLKDMFYYTLHVFSGKVIGINNLGYTCFLNSLLQALAACPIFIGWLKKQYDKNGKVNFISTLLSVFESMQLFSITYYLFYEFFYYFYYFMNLKKN